MHITSIRSNVRPALLALAVLLVIALPARAGCSVSSTGMAFGSYQGLTFPGKLASADSSSNASISVVCSNILIPGSFSLALGPSASGAGDRISTRYLANAVGGPNLQFNIYTNPSNTTVWGDGNVGSIISGSIPVTTVGSHTQSVTVYGKIQAGQSMLKAGSYSGVMAMTMTYNP